MSRTYLGNPDFAAYARLLFRLHGLIATEAGESAEADEIRDQMDAAWSRPGAPERDDLRKLSEQLYAFHADSTAATATA